VCLLIELLDLLAARSLDGGLLAMVRYMVRYMHGGLLHRYYCSRGKHLSGSLHGSLHAWWKAPEWFVTWFVTCMVEST